MEKVSIITPVYNASTYIEKTIISVLKQTYTNYELILVNDKSNDNSLDICYKYSKKDDRIKVIDLKDNLGVSNARNIAIESASGRYIAFLDADDMWTKDKLEKQINAMIKTNSKISCTSYYRVDENDNILSAIDILEKITYKDMLKNNYVACLSLIYDVEFFGKRYFKELSKNEDYLLWLELIKKSEYIQGINERLAYYRVLKNSRSSSKLKVILVRWEIYRKYEKLSLLKSIYYFINYAIRAVIKNRSNKNV